MVKRRMAVTSELSGPIIAPPPFTNRALSVGGTIVRHDPQRQPRRWLLNFGQRTKVSTQLHQLPCCITTMYPRFENPDTSKAPKREPRWLFQVQTLPIPVLLPSRVYRSLVRTPAYQPCTFSSSTRAPDIPWQRFVLRHDRSQRVSSPGSDRTEEQLCAG